MVNIERDNFSGLSILPALRKVTSSMPACTTEHNFAGSIKRVANKDN